MNTIKKIWYKGLRAYAYFRALKAKNFNNTWYWANEWRYYNSRLTKLHY